tara:strand:- start:238 stop:1131 length:894 start_codon:yes stop_codon:yes gene_type:complete
MKMKYGCEIASDLTEVFSNQYVEWLSSIGIKQVIKLKKRQKGLTSGGKPHNCHVNVYQLTSTFGGRHKHGFLVREFPSELLTETLIEDKPDILQENERVFIGCLIYHSAWLTPENKLVCVTGKDVHEDSVENIKSNILGTTPEYDYFFVLDNDFQEESRYYDGTWHRQEIGSDSLLVETFKATVLSAEELEDEGELMPIELKHYRDLFHFSQHTSRHLKEGYPLRRLKLLCREEWKTDEKMPSNFPNKSILTNRTFYDIIKDDKHSRFRDDYSSCVYVNRKQKRKVFKERDKQTYTL